MRYNIRKFHYQDGVQIRVYTIPVKTGRKKGAEAEQEKQEGQAENTKSDTDRPDALQKHCTGDSKERSALVSMNRSKQMIYGIARANEWQYFLTLTFDRGMVDSSNYKEVVIKSRRWLENLRRRTSPDIKYLIVPELHSDNIHWHMHGLLADCPELSFSDSGHKTPSGLPVYNLQNWKYGFSTVTEVTHNSRVSAYISKYITKDMAVTLRGRQRYWCSNNVIRPMEVCEHDFIEKPGIEIVREYSGQADHISSCISSNSFQTITYMEVSSHEE